MSPRQASPLPDKTPLLILGAGPTGLEAAAHAYVEGREFTLLEADEIAASIRRWGHVRLFSPWSLNTSSAGRAILEQSNHPLPSGDEFPTGHEYVEQYLNVMATHAPIANNIFTGVRARRASRRNTLKGEFIGSSVRRERPFLVLWRDSSGAEGVIEANTLIDATGVYANPNATGDGGIPAVGEELLEGRIQRHLFDPKEDPARYGNKHSVVVGSGYSAATLVRDLLALLPSCNKTAVTWVTRSTTDTPLTPIDSDPLPERRALTDLANGWISNPPAGLTVQQGLRVYAFRTGTHHPIAVQCFDSQQRTVEIECDEMISLVGYHPDLSLLTELQVHHCYATDGLMKVSVALLSSAGSGADCLAVEAPGAKTLLNPEPDLFVLGSKSFGRFSQYLMKNGIEQVEQAFSLIGQEQA